MIKPMPQRPFAGTFSALWKRSLELTAPPAAELGVAGAFAGAFAGDGHGNRHDGGSRVDRPANCRNAPLQPRFALPRTGLRGRWNEMPGDAEPALEGYNMQ